MRRASSWSLRALLGLLLATASVGAASAATLVVDGDGLLIGGRDVDLDGVLYEVQFRDDTFTNIFGDASGLDATSEAEAVSFAQALIEQLFLDSDLGLFDTDPELIFGCSEGDRRCEVLIPFAVDGILVETVTALNRRAESSFEDEVQVRAITPTVDGDQGQVTTRVYADFALQGPAAAVPAIGPTGLIALASLLLGTGVRAVRRPRS